MASLFFRRLYKLLLGISAAPGDAIDPPPYEFPPPTCEELLYADLSIIDLSLSSTLEGRKKLAAQVTEAMHRDGFFYVVNHGYSQEQTNRIFSIGNLFFDNVSPEEKKVYEGKSPEVYEGYKPRQLWQLGNGISDQIEHYNINRQRCKDPLSHPEAIRPYLKDLDNFARHNHFNILYPLLRIMALGLDLPEETLVNQHRYGATGESSARFMKYYSRSADEELKAKNVWLKGHTDIGSVTILWSQPVSGLQILSPDGKWRWVKHMDNALVVNSGDALGFLCGGFYPPTRHRVIQPPRDQAEKARLGAFYFSMPEDNVPLKPYKESPVLKDKGIPVEYDPQEPPVMETWRRTRARTYGQIQLKAGKEEGVEEEIVAGIVVKHWN